MFRRVCLFELRMRLRARSTWVLFGILAVKTFTDFLSGYWDAVIGSSVPRNSPYSAYLMFTYSAFWAATLGAGAMTVPLLRDLRTRTGVLVYAAPVGDRTYFVAKYVAGLLAFAVSLSGVYVGYALVGPAGTAFSLLSPQAIMPTPWAQSLHAFVLGTGVAAFVWGTLHFSLAAWTGRPAASYVAAAALFMVFIVIDSVFGRGVDARALAQVLDPLGKAAFDGQAAYWSAAERSTKFVSMTGTLLVNRLLYVGLAAAFWLVSLRRFDLRVFLGHARPRRAPLVASRAIAPTVSGGASLLSAALSFDGGLRYGVRLAVRTGWMQFRQLTREAPLRVALLVLVALSAIAGGDMGGYFTPPSGRMLPVAMVALPSIVNSVYVPALLLVLFFTAELVSRDRVSRTSALVDAAPAPLWSRVLAHLIAVGCLVLLVAMLPAAALVVVQLPMRIIEPEPSHILQATLVALAPSLALYAVLSVVWYAITVSRSAAQALGIVSAMAVIIFHEVGAIRHQLLLYGFPYTSFYSGFDAGAVLLRRQMLTWLYWAGLGSMLLAFAYWIWPEGVNVAWRARVARTRSRIGRPSLALALGGLVTCGVTGVWLFRAINVQAAYESIDRAERESAAYERRYGATAPHPQPKIVSARLAYTIRPDAHALTCDARLMVVNPSSAPISELHVEPPEFGVLRSIALNGQPLKPGSRDAALRHDVYILDPALGPHEQALLSFDVDLRYDGFSNDGHHGTIVADGSVITPAMLPRFGYDRTRENRPLGVRRRQGLGPRAALPPATAAASVANDSLADDGDHVALEIVVRSPRDQIVAAPGARLAVADEGGDRVVTYATEHLVPWNPYVVSARFARAEARWMPSDAPPVDIEVLYTPSHHWNVRRFIEAARVALDHFTMRYGPYPYRSLRIVEVPDGFSGLQTSGNLVLLPEREGWLHDYRTDPPFDWIEFAVSRALARTWWGDMTTAADVQGALLITEALPMYEGLSVIDARHGANQVTRFLRVAADDYLKQRALDDAGEPALVQADGQPYLPLRGVMALWAVDAMIGRTRVEQALRRFRAAYARQEPPFAGATRLIEALAEDTEPGERQRIEALFMDSHLKVEPDGTFRDRDPAAAAVPVPTVTSRYRP